VLFSIATADSIAAAVPPIGLAREIDTTVRIITEDV